MVDVPTDHDDRGDQQEPHGQVRQHRPQVAAHQEPSQAVNAFRIALAVHRDGPPFRRSTSRYRNKTSASHDAQPVRRSCSQSQGIQCRRGAYQQSLGTPPASQQQFDRRAISCGDHIIHSLRSFSQKVPYNTTANRDDSQVYPYKMSTQDSFLTDDVLRFRRPYGVEKNGNMSNQLASMLSVFERFRWREAVLEKRLPRLGYATACRSLMMTFR